MAKSLFLMVLTGVLGLFGLGSLFVPTDSASLSEDDDVAATAEVSEEPVKIDDNSKEGFLEAEKETEKSEEKAVENNEKPAANATQSAAQTTAKSVQKSSVKPVTQTAKPATNTAKPAAQPASKPAPKPAAPANSITIAGNTIEIVNVSSVVDSGNHVNRIQKLLYGHNYASIFGGISRLGVGSTFVVRVNGRETTYRVGSKVYYDKDNSTANGALRRNGGKKNYMNSIARAYDYDAGVSYDLAIMTCAGQPLGGGDATQRLVLYAKAI
ncbi:hypothetical protein IKF92_02445 [Candidatus Saccharibacteria bacterium]|nr:hypothetical protein [Candidatus Saccharibacteria bacterium]